MDTLKPFLRLFTMDEWGYTATMRRQRWVARLILTLYPMICLPELLYLLHDLWFAWQFNHSAWGNFWNLLYPTVVMCVLPLRYLVAIESSPGAALRNDFQALRRGLVASDDALAPVAKRAETLRPAQLDLLDSPARIGRIPRMYSNSERVIAWLATVLLPTSLGVLWLIVLSLQMPDTFAPLSTPTSPLTAYSFVGALISRLLACLVTLAFGAGAIFGAVSTWRAIRFKGDLAVKVDEQGVEWRRTPWSWAPTRQPWSSARAFYSVTLKSTWGWTEQRVYALDFGVYILAWKITVVSNRYAEKRVLAREQAERGASARLCAAITLHTSLQERDVTELAKRIVETKGQLIEEARRIATEAGDIEASAMLEPPDVWRLPTRPVDPSLSPLDFVWDALTGSASDEATERQALTHNEEQIVNYALALLPYTGKRACNADIPGLAELVDHAGLLRTIYVMIGVNVAILALVTVIAACAQFL